MTSAAAPPEDARRPLSAPLLAAVAAALPLVFRAASYTDRILDRDETYWMAAALRMRHEHLPVYVAGWDTKPPLAFWFHRTALAALPDAPMLGAHILAAVLAAAACALVAIAARRLADGSRHAGLAGLLAALLFALLDSTGEVHALAANTELLTYVPVAVLALAVATERPRGARLPLLVGACSAIAFLAKHPAAVYAPFGCVAILVAERDGRSWLVTIVAGLAGVALVLAPAFGWIAAAGAWDDFVACNVTISGHRAKFAAELAEQYDYGRWAGVAKANAVALAGLAFAAFQAVRPGADLAMRRAALAIGPLVAAGMVAAVAGGTGFQHYLQMAYVPVAVLAGVGLASAGVPFARLRPVAVLVFWTALALAVAAPDRLIQVRRARTWAGYDSGAIPALRARVEELTTPADTIQAWGIHPDLYVTCRRAPASRFVTTNWLVGTYTGKPSASHPEPFEFVPGSWDTFLRDLDASRPALVIDSAAAGVHGFDAYPIARFPRFQAWLAERYTPEAGPGGYVLWVRKAR